MLFGNRKGDHAPKALLELVDNPRDLKLEITARAMGRSHFLNSSSSSTSTESTSSVTPTLSTLSSLSTSELSSHLASQPYGPLTLRNLDKVKRYSGESALRRLVTRSLEHSARLRAIEELEGPILSPGSSSSSSSSSSTWRSGEEKKEIDENATRGGTLTLPSTGRKLRAGQRSPKEEVAELSYKGRRRASGQGRTDVINNGRGAGTGEKRRGGKSVIRVAQGVFAKRKF